MYVCIKSQTRNALDETLHEKYIFKSHEYLDCIS